MSATPPRRPAFARDFPRHAALESLIDAFARGDYARVRAEAPRLAASAEAPEVRDAARALLARTSPDPLAVVLLALAAVLLALLTAFWIVHGKAPPARPLPPPSIERVH